MASATATPQLMTREDIATEMKISIRTLARLIATDRFPAADVKVGNIRRWRRSTYERWVSRGKQTGV